MVRLKLDTHLCAPRAVGTRAGLTEQEVRAWTGRLAQLQPMLDEATQADLLPHQRVASKPGDVVQAVAEGAAWSPPGRGKSDRLIIVGEPGAASAATLLASGVAEGGPEGVHSAAVVAVTQPDGRQLAAALAGVRRPRLLVLNATPWAGALALQAGVKASSITFLDDVASNDVRFAVFGRASWLAAGRSGVAVDPLCDGLGTAAQQCAELTLRDNPAARLAVVSRALQEGHGLRLPVLVTAGSLLGAWAAWARRCWAAFSSRSVPAGAGYRAVGVAPLCLTVGDEALVQRVIAGPRDLWAILVETDLHGDDPVQHLARQLLDGHQRQLLADGRPVVRVRLRDESPTSLAQLSWVWTHAALVAAALDPVDPLTLDAADDWRGLLKADPTG